MKKRVVVALLLFPFALAAAQQQPGRPVFAFVGISSLDQEVSQAEIRVLENRLTTALVGIAEAQGYSVIIPRNRDLIRNQIGPISDNGTSRNSADLAEMVAAQGVVVGEVHRIGERYFLDLQVIATESGNTMYAYSAEYEAYTAALEGGLEAMYTLFGIRPTESSTPHFAEMRTETPDSTDPSRFTASPSVDLLTGRWTGDLGIDSIELFADGSGLARIPGGHTMRLRFGIENSRILVVQDEPNAPKLYLGSFPYSLAVQIVELARPMRWIFRLTGDGDRLVGSKETTSVRVDQGQVIGADNSYSRPAEWKRLP